MKACPVKLDLEFYARPATELAPEICGKILCVKQPDGDILKTRILETECYFGEEDTACHAHHGKTKRTEVMYRKGGAAYIYLCYGMHNMLNIVTGPEGHPQAVLIRGVEGAAGPGRVTKLMHIDRTLNGVSLVGSGLLWLEDDGGIFRTVSEKRIGIDYASEQDRNRLWRFRVLPGSESSQSGNILRVTE